MNVAQTTDPISRKPLRLWPGMAAAVLLVVVRLMPIVFFEILPVAMMGAVLGALAALAIGWWCFSALRQARARAIPAVPGVSSISGS